MTSYKHAWFNGFFAIGLSISSYLSAVESEFQFHKYDHAQIQKDILNVFENRRAEDRAYLKSTLKEINQKITSLASQEYVALLNMSAVSHSKVSLQEFLNARQKYELKKSLLEQTIRSLDDIPSSTDEVHLVDGFIVKLLTNLSEFDDQLSKTEFKLELPNGELFLQNGINLEALKDKKIFNPAEYSAIRKLVGRKRAVSHEVKQQIDTYGLYGMRLANTFIDAYGESQRYKTQQNNNGLELAKQNLEEYFWSRSYLRYVYGISLGSYGITYSKDNSLVGNLVGRQNFKQLPLSFHSGMVRSVPELTKMQDLAFDYLGVISEKSKDVLSFETKFFSRFASFKAFLEGADQVNRATELVLKYVIADIEEELVLNTTGLKATGVTYRKRYQKNTSDEAYYDALKNKYDGSVDENDMDADVKRMDTDSLAGVFVVAKSALDTHQDNLELAQILETKLELMRADSKHKSNAEKRKNRK